MSEMLCPLKNSLKLRCLKARHAWEIPEPVVLLLLNCGQNGSSNRLLDAPWLVRRLVCCDVQWPTERLGVALSFFQHNPLGVIWTIFGVLWLLAGNLRQTDYPKTDLPFAPPAARVVGGSLRL